MGGSIGDSGSPGSTYRWGNLLRFVLPDGWNARQVDDVLEFAPDDGSGAGQITFLRIDEERIAFDKESGLRLLDSFVRAVSGESEDLPLLEESSDEIVVRQNLVGSTMDWHVGVKLWRSAAVVVSYCYGRESQAGVDAADEVFRGIQLGSEATA